MGHSISAIIGKAPISKTIAKSFDLPTIERDQFIIIPLNACHSDFWTDKLDLNEFEDRDIILDCVSTHYFAKKLFKNKPYAIIETDYFGGTGDQAALLYQDGKLIKDEGRQSIGPINRILKELGVNKGVFKDEFDRMGLGNYRYFENYFSKYDD